MTRLSAFAAAVMLLVAVPALAEDPITPDPRLTPGAVLTTDTGAICQPGYTKTVRHTSGRVKSEIYREYGIDRKGGHYEVDHLISLELGGADVRENLWPQSYDTQPWNASVKDQLENFLHAEVCAGRMPIEQAQREIATDWIATYRKYLGEPTPMKRRRRR
jgi:hypothetical protein